MVEALRNFPTDERIQREAMKAISKLAYKENINKERLFDAGARGALEGVRGRAPHLRDRAIALAAL